MKVVAIIQARMRSTRLPGKVLTDIAGETALARVIERLRRSSSLDLLVVATSTLAENDAIARECQSADVECFRGSEADVLDRYFLAAREYEADAIVRITADCPLIDPELVDDLVNNRQNKRTHA